LLYNKFMDAVYILGNGSLANNDEIRISLRSLEKYMLDLGNVYIIGELPDFAKNVIHLPSKDYSVDKWKNAYNKVKNACQIDDLSDEFLLMNDDFFMLEPFTGADWPFYSLRNSNGGSCGANSFHIHCPIRIKKDWFLNMPFSIDQKACRSPRSFYANFYRAPVKQCDDFILRVGVGMRDPELQIIKWPSFSISDSAMLYKPFVQWLFEKYPLPSKFEIN